MAFGTKHREKEGEKPLPTRYFSKKQENAVAKSLGGSRQPNSGATAWAKSDVLLEQFTIECKTKMTDSESISIKKDWIKKQQEESAFMGKPYWTIAFNFGPDQDNYYIIDESLFIDLQEYLKNREEK